MKHIVLAAILVLGGFGGVAQADQETGGAAAPDSAPAAEEQTAPFFLPVLEGWGTETIPFPLGFAPELEYEGFEELRFAPGMFKLGSEDFWTYAIVWWLPAATTINAQVLQTDLVNYFRGLGNQPDNPDIRAKINSVGGRDGTPVMFAGSLTIFDSFVTREMVTLNLQAEVVPCESQDKIAVFIELSPQPMSHPVWASLREIRQGFRCQQ